MGVSWLASAKIQAQERGESSLLGDTSALEHLRERKDWLAVARHRWSIQMAPTEKIFLKV